MHVRLAEVIVHLLLIRCCFILLLVLHALDYVECAFVQAKLKFHLLLLATPASRLAHLNLLVVVRCDASVAWRWCCFISAALLLW